jgi:hypothetical protein
METLILMSMKLAITAGPAERRCMPLSSPASSLLGNGVVER